ncbi:lamin tail domain-containing protein, partial [Streptomyces sp. NPDC087850]|uniref:lamin tail domain-containing protein n=1 Tax=Streptomyces sp. NPDC087850 TaxID=3365809 RepID=UPI00381E682C
MSSSIPPALRGRRARLIALTLPVSIAGSLIALPSAQALPSPDAVIAEVYGGGGNSGATLTHDFIELGNAGGAAFDLTGWSVQYLSGSPSSTTKWSVTPLSGTVPAGGSYLIQGAKGAGGDTALPTPDATGTLALSASSGTVALVHSTTALTCVTAADCAADGSVKDLVGFGTAAVRETSPATGADNTHSVGRTAALTDTDDNSADLTGQAPTPRNSAGTGTGGGEPVPTPSPTDTTPGELRIHDIQGATRLSPYA